MEWGEVPSLPTNEPRENLLYLMLWNGLWHFYYPRDGKPPSGAKLYYIPMIFVGEVP